MGNEGNWFESISDWRDEDERWEPKIYRTFTGVLENTAFGTIDYEGVERDWNVLGYTFEENLALGRVVEVVSEMPGLVG